MILMMYSVNMSLLSSRESEMNTRRGLLNTRFSHCSMNQCVLQEYPGVDPGVWNTGLIPPPLSQLTGKLLVETSCRHEENESLHYVLCV